MKKACLILFSVILSSPLSPAQKQTENRKITLDGYVSSMESAMFDTLSGPMLFENLIHNRLNFKAHISSSITFAVELRNRLFTGDMVRSGKLYSKMTETDPGWVDMSWNPVNENSFFINTTIDRLWLDFNYNKIQVRIGRQRINWGQTFVWNPNDIFNTYSFFDFDYVERPGSDAVRIQYYPTSTSVFELAAKMNSIGQVTTAGLYRFSRWGYDIQVLGGLSNSSDLVAGAGWSGSIGSVSFRGEGTWFRPVRHFADTAGTIIITAGIDKIFDDNSMFQSQIMYCSNPPEIVDFTSLYKGSLSAKDVAFSRFSAFGQFTWAATPLFNLGISAMWLPGLKGYFAGPTLDYSLAGNLDFSIIWQYFNSMTGSSRTRINLAFLRIKYSF